MDRDLHARISDLVHGQVADAREKSKDAIVRITGISVAVFPRPVDVYNECPPQETILLDQHFILKVKVWIDENPSPIEGSLCDIGTRLTIRIISEELAHRGELYSSLIAQELDHECIRIGRMIDHMLWSSFKKVCEDNNGKFPVDITY